MMIDFTLKLDFEWWHLLVWFALVFITSYVWHATKAIAQNDMRKQAERRKHDDV